MLYSPQNIRIFGCHEEKKFQAKFCFRTALPLEPEFASLSFELLVIYILLKIVIYLAPLHKQISFGSPDSW